MMMYTTLQSYIEVNFALMHHHKWSLTEIENLMPWERDVYVSLLITHLKEEERRYKERQAKNS